MAEAVADGGTLVVAAVYGHEASGGLGVANGDVGLARGQRDERRSGDRAIGVAGCVGVLASSRRQVARVAHRRGEDVSTGLLGFKEHGLHDGELTGAAVGELDLEVVAVLGSNLYEDHLRRDGVVALHADLDADVGGLREGTHLHQDDAIRASLPRQGVQLHTRRWRGGAVVGGREDLERQTHVRNGERIGSEEAYLEVGVGLEEQLERLSIGWIDHLEVGTLYVDRVQIGSVLEPIGVGVGVLRAFVTRSRQDGEGEDGPE